MGLQLGGDFGKKQLDLGLMSGGTQLLDVYGQGTSPGDNKLGIKSSIGLGGGLQLDPSLARLQTDGKGSTSAGLSLGGDGVSANAAYTHGDEGGNTLGLGLSTSAGGTGTSRNTSIDFDKGEASNSFKWYDPTTWFSASQKSNADGDKVGLEGGTKIGDNTISGGFTAGQAIDGFTLGAAQSLGEKGSLSEHLGMQFGDQGTSTSFGMSSDIKPGGGLALSSSLDASLGADGHNTVGGKFGESFRSKGFAETLSLGGSSDSAKGESFNAGGSLAAQVAPGLYASGFGNVNDASGKDPSYFAGGGLTYMPNDKLGLTAAGGYGSDGWEARLQADFFKKGVDGAGGLEDQRNKAAVSGYLGVSGGGGNKMDDFYGAPDVSKQFGGGPTFSVGLGVGF